MPGQHSRIGASGADGALACPGKIAAEAPFPNISTLPAVEGSVFHEVVQNCLEEKGTPDDYLFELFEVDEGEDGSGGELWTIMVDRPMHRHLTEGLRKLYDLMERMGPDTVMFIERRVILEPWLGEGEFGTSDVILVNVKTRKIVVWDWKYGIGVPVFPTWNLQAILYVLGSWHTIVEEMFDYDPTDIEVDIVIHQPRIPTAGGVWSTTMMDLLEYGKGLPARAAKTLEADAPRIPGEKQCRFCRARHVCGERARARLYDLKMDFDDLDAADMVASEITMPPIADLTNAQRSTIALNAPDFILWVKAVQASVEKDLRAGRAEGHALKMVAGNRRPPRAYSKEHLGRVTAILSRNLGDEAFTKKVLSPTQLAERFPAAYETVEQYIARGESKPILVPKHDPRPALKGIIEEFEDLSGDDE